MRFSLNVSTKMAKMVPCSEEFQVSKDLWPMLDLFSSLN